MDPLSAIGVFVAAVAAFVLGYLRARRAGKARFDSVYAGEQEAINEVQSMVVTPSSPDPLPAPPPGDDTSGPAPCPGDPPAPPRGYG